LWIGFVFLVVSAFEVGSPYSRERATPLQLPLTALRIVIWLSDNRSDLNDAGDKANDDVQSDADGDDFHQ
jgi:hypothetical protein